jgi:hypothetical protein
MSSLLQAHFSCVFKVFIESSLTVTKYFFFKDGMFSNWTTDLSHLRSEEIFNHLSLKKDSQVTDGVS